MCHLLLGFVLLTVAEVDESYVKYLRARAETGSAEDQLNLGWRFFAMPSLYDYH